jgi:deubiquitinase DESI2
MSNDHLQVYLNVYDISETNSYTHNLGLGAYHSGVELRNTEYTFGQSGVFNQFVFYFFIFKSKPRDIQNAKFREAIHMGETSVSTIQELNQILQELSKEFPSSSYNLTTKFETFQFC